MTRRRLTVLGLLALAVGTLLLASQTAEHAPIVRTVAIGTDPQALAVAPHVGRVVVVNQGDMSLRMLEATSGRLLATSSVPGPPDALLVDEPTQRVWVTTSFGIITLYDLHRSTPITMIVPNDTKGVSVRRLMADAPRRHVVIASVNGYGASATGHGVGYVSILDARSGALLHVTPVGNLPAALAIDERTAHIFVASLGPTNRSGDPIGRGSVSMLDARTGHVERMVPVGISPDVLAIDETTNRVFIATSAVTARAERLQHVVQGARRASACPCPSARTHPYQTVPLFLLSIRGDQPLISASHHCRPRLCRPRRLPLRQSSRILRN